MKIPVKATGKNSLTPAAVRTGLYFHETKGWRCLRAGAQCGGILSVGVCGRLSLGLLGSCYLFRGEINTSLTKHEAAEQAEVRQPSLGGTGVQGDLPS